MTTISKKKQRSTKSCTIYSTVALSAVVIWLALLLHSHFYYQTAVKQTSTQQQQHRSPLRLPFEKRARNVQESDNNLQHDSPNEFLSHDWSLPIAFEEVLDRARSKRQDCLDLVATDVSDEMDERTATPVGNETIASLPSFGIIHALEAWQMDPQAQLQKVQATLDGESAHFYESALDWQCQLPPTTECDVTHFTVIFMAYNPDRLSTTMSQMKNMLEQSDWKSIVHQVILVWNGPRSIDESPAGQNLLKYASENSSTLRIVYPLKMGLVNDLMNRYHPKVVNVETKAILYYDDDGPFYSFAAVQAGFELWKRHSSQQLGAMARQINLGPRQLQEQKQQVPNIDTDESSFTSHCTNAHDVVEYNFRYFANYDANMVLPSGSFLHSNYLCFLWHPVLEQIRHFVRLHPVHPDDVTVSMVVSQLAGMAPRVYSRRLNPEKAKTETTKRRLNEVANVRSEQSSGENYGIDSSSNDSDSFDDTDDYFDHLTGLIPLDELQRHRRLLFGIDWDAGQHMTSAKQYWADLRSQAVNSLVRYFGSINNGSIGWCEGTQYYNPKDNGGKCTPAMAKIGWLPWMEPGTGTLKSTCP